MHSERGALNKDTYILSISNHHLQNTVTTAVRGTHSLQKTKFLQKDTLKNASIIYIYIYTFIQNIHFLFGTTEPQFPIPTNQSLNLDITILILCSLNIQNNILASSFDLMDCHDSSARRIRHGYTTAGAHWS